MILMIHCFHLGLHSLPLSFYNLFYFGSSGLRLNSPKSAIRLKVQSRVASLHWMNLHSTIKKGDGRVRSINRLRLVLLWIVSLITYPFIRFLLLTTFLIIQHCSWSLTTLRGRGLCHIIEHVSTASWEEWILDGCWRCRLKGWLFQ